MSALRLREEEEAQRISCGPTGPVSRVAVARGRRRRATAGTGKTQGRRNGLSELNSTSCPTPLRRQGGSSSSAICPGRPVRAPKALAIRTAFEHRPGVRAIPHGSPSALLRSAEADDGGRGLRSGRRPWVSFFRSLQGGRSFYQTASDELNLAVRCTCTIAEFCIAAMQQLHGEIAFFVSRIKGWRMNFQRPAKTCRICPLSDPALRTT